MEDSSQSLAAVLRAGRYLFAIPLGLFGIQHLMYAHAPDLANIPRAMFLIFVAMVHAPRVARDLYDGHQWANLLVPVCLSGAGLIFAGFYSPP